MGKRVGRTTHTVREKYFMREITKKRIRDEFYALKLEIIKAGYPAITTNKPIISIMDRLQTVFCFSTGLQLICLVIEKRLSSL